MRADRADARLRGKGLQRGIGQPHESRAQQRCRAQIRFGCRQVAQQREHVLDLVRFEKTEPFVHVRRNVLPLQRLLEILVAVFRPEEDADVLRGHRPELARVRVAHERLRVEQSADLRRDRVCVIGDARRRDEAERVARGYRPLDGKPVILAKAEGIAALLVFFDLAEHVIGKRKELRHRAEAP